jgi:hypothetical protein
MKSFNDFLQRLERVEWSPVGYIDKDVLELLTELGRAPWLIREAVDSWNPRQLEKRGLRCHETTTHYKWFVHYHESLQYRVWLHQYKSHNERRRGHAEVPHNHRYSLASLIVLGGLVNHHFERADGRLRELEAERRSHSQGDVYMVEWRRVHKLSGLSDGTVTLVVESPVVRHFSEAFYDGTDQPRLFYDFTGLHSRLSAEMTSL